MTDEEKAELKEKDIYKKILEDAVEEKRKGVKIEFIWLNICSKCRTKISHLDEEYSFEYKTENASVSLDELLDAFNYLVESYGIYENTYQEETKNFEYIGLDDYDNVEVFYYYIEDFSAQEWCHICEKVF